MGSLQCEGGRLRLVSHNFRVASVRQEVDAY